MMNRFHPISIMFALSLTIFGSGCGSSLVAFSHELREQHSLTNDDLRNLQWYVSHRITLRRELESGGRQVTGNHKLLLVSGKTIEEVIVEEHTPGIAVAVGEGFISVAFEPGSPLNFSARTGRFSPEPTAVQTFAEPPNPFPGQDARGGDTRSEDTQRSSDLFSGNYFLAIDSGGRITFQTRVFEAVEDSFQAHLLIDAESLEEVVKNRKVLPGMRLSGD